MKKFGDVARIFYSRWQHRQMSILELQERNTYNSLYNLHGYLMNRILEDASSGTKFCRFYYSELSSLNKYDKPISEYEVKIMFDEENFDVMYDGDSFVVRWAAENELK